MARAPAPGVLGVFDHVDATTAAVDRLRKAGLRDLTVYAPLPHHDIEHALHRPESSVRVFTLVGGLTGAATGFALPIWTSLDWPLITGGKPIISIPPFVIIAFELTVLFGALATVLGLFLNILRARPTVDYAYDPSFSAGRFGLFVASAGGREDEVGRILAESGAVEVREERSESHA